MWYMLASASAGLKSKKGAFFVVEFLKLENFCNCIRHETQGGALCYQIAGLHPLCYWTTGAFFL